MRSETPDSAGLLRNLNFLLLWQGQLVSQLGNQAFLIATMFWTMERTGSASLVGALLVCSTLPAIVLGPFGGTFADRHSRKWILVVSDFLKGVAILVVAAVFLWRPDRTELMLAMLFGAATLGGTVNAAFMPAVTAIIPDLVPRPHVAKANALSQLSGQATTLIGQALAGVAYRLVGAPLLLLVDGVTYLVSALSETFISLPARPRAAYQGGRRRLLREIAAETADGLRYLIRRPGMATFLLVTAALNLLFMPVFVLLPFYVTDVLGAGAEWYGFLLAGLSGGSLGGTLIAGRIRLSGVGRSRLLTAALLVAAGGILASAIVHTRLVALGLFVLLGACTGLINVFVFTLLQLGTAAGMRGRVMALALTLSGAATPLGMGLGGVIGDLTGKNLPLVFGVCGALAVSAVLLAARTPSFRAFLADDAVATGEQA